MIKVKGSQVAPAELEALLLGHPAVADAAVIGVTKYGLSFRRIAALTDRSIGARRSCLGPTSFLKKGNRCLHRTLCLSWNNESVKRKGSLEGCASSTPSLRTRRERSYARCYVKRPRWRLAKACRSSRWDVCAIMFSL